MEITVGSCLALLAISLVVTKTSTMDSRTYEEYEDIQHLMTEQLQKTLINTLNEQLSSIEFPMSTSSSVFFSNAKRNATMSSLQVLDRPPFVVTNLSQPDSPKSLLEKHGPNELMQIIWTMCLSNIIFYLEEENTTSKGYSVIFSIALPNITVMLDVQSYVLTGVRVVVGPMRLKYIYLKESDETLIINVSQYSYNELYYFLELYMVNLYRFVSFVKDIAVNVIFEQTVKLFTSDKNKDEIQDWILRLLI